MSVVNLIILVDNIDIIKRKQIRDIVSSNITKTEVKNGCTFILNIISVGDMDVVNITYNKDENKMNVNGQLFIADKFYILISHYRENIQSATINNTEISSLNDFQDDYSCKWVKPIPDAEVYFCSISGNLIGEIFNNFQELINNLTC